MGFWVYDIFSMKYGFLRLDNEDLRLFEFDEFLIFFFNKKHNDLDIL